MNRFMGCLAAAWLVFASVRCGTAQAQAEDRAQLKNTIVRMRTELKTLEGQFLAPSKEDLAEHADILQLPDSGLIRLLPREVYENILTLRGGGAYYSFTRKTHEYGHGSDIELQEGNLNVGFAGGDYGLMAEIGDAPLEALSMNDLPVKALASHVPSRQAAAQARTGLKINDMTFCSSVNAVAEKTYILRSISFDRSDVLVAFRIVRKDADGSVILLWRMLNQFQSPRAQ
ncbi:MAG: hypothetical protein AB1696_26570 [Planctomycetota bacterium]